MSRKEEEKRKKLRITVELGSDGEQSDEVNTSLTHRMQAVRISLLFSKHSHSQLVKYGSLVSGPTLQ